MLEPDPVAEVPAIPDVTPTNSVIFAQDGFDALRIKAGGEPGTVFENLLVEPDRLEEWSQVGSWDDLWGSTRPYTDTIQLADGSIMVWWMEDWEIYGPGSGGYSSPGAYSPLWGTLAFLQSLQNYTNYLHNVDMWQTAQLDMRSSEPSTQLIRVNGTATWFNPATGDMVPLSASTPVDPWPDVKQIVITGTRPTGGTSVDLTVFNLGSDHIEGAASDRVSGPVLDTLLGMDRGVYEVDESRVGPLTTEQRAAVDTLKNLIAEVVARLNGLEPAAIFISPLLGGTPAPVSELKELLLMADWRLWPAGHQFANGQYTGQVDRNNGNPVFDITIDTLVNWMKWPDASIWYILHDLVHTAPGFWNNRTANGIEGFVSDVAKAIAAKIRMPISDSFNPAPSWGPGGVHYQLPPTNGDGSGGGSGGDGGGGGGGGGPGVHSSY